MKSSPVDGKTYPFVSQAQVELAYSSNQPTGLLESQEFLGQPGQGLVLELRIRVVFNHPEIFGVVQPNAEERSEVAYLRTHREPDTRTHYYRIAIQPDSLVLSDSEDAVVGYFHQHWEPLLLECCATKKVQTSRSGDQ